MLDAASIAAIAITEPQAGADLSRLATTAERSGRTFVLRGRKTWVTHGLTADVFIVLARTADGPTRFIVPGNTQGLERTALEVVGLKHLTFAELQFDACTISEDHVFGAVGKGLEGTKAAFPIRARSPHSRPCVWEKRVSTSPEPTRAIAICSDATSPTVR